VCGLFPAALAPAGDRVRDCSGSVPRGVEAG
jgi:hypothetical protein